MSEPAAAVHPQKAMDHAMQVAVGYMGSAAMGVAAELNIADHLAHGAMPVSELAAKAGVNEDALYRMLRALSSLGVFTEVGLRYFANSPASELLRSEGEGSVRDLIIFMADEFHFQIWGKMMLSVKNGKPAVEQIYGKPGFQVFKEMPEEQERFNRAMTNFSARLDSAVVAAYDFSGAQNIVDVAGGQGKLISTVLARNPQMRGVLFDMEHVLAGARPVLEKAGVLDRCELVSGDFFKSVPSGDLYTLQHIIHDWADEKAVLILKNIRQAMGTNPKGRVLIIEGLIVPGPQGAMTNFKDLEMLLMPGGRERSEDEFKELLAAAGFKLNRVIPTESPVSIMEGVPR